MKKKFEKFWADKSDPLHRFDTDEHLFDYGEEIRLIFKRDNINSVLDIGCGSGSLYEPLQFDKVERFKGVDFSATMLEAFHKNHPNVDLVCADGSSFNDGKKYDLIFSNGCVQNFSNSMLREHFKNADDMLAEGGQFIIASNPWRALRFSYMTGEAGPKAINHNFIKGCLYRIIRGGRAFGMWRSAHYLAKIGKELGYDMLTYGSVHYPYRFHAKFKK